ncbi:hypothetical protein NZ47_02745 [Anaerovibrio lipolyticus]|uniref:Uncharacterized protein n=1 Tax=Anaerovibrio lipolyticus TaxID=82374 RepID=A0A0B2K1L8_9FIRM|nr:hypothetical protein [Anaerovibrio lipolyticus]KHM52773.1 hypothetical protein NZ47_02745 [Anaerovibrio lipolyticus]
MKWFGKFMLMCSIAIILFSYSPAAEALTSDNVNRHLTKYELQIINDALLEYQALHKDKALPKDLIELFRSPALTAEEATDNRDHVFIEKFFFTKDAGIGNVIGHLIPPLQRNEKINIVKNNQVIDLWEQPIFYRVNQDNSFELYSLGINGEKITKDTDLNIGVYENVVEDDITKSMGFKLFIAVGGVLIALRWGLGLDHRL